MQPGDLISSKYRLLKLLGAGGMGSVWAARNELTDRDFAIKFLLPDLAKNRDALQRFFLEARACGQIKHPAIVDVYDMGQADDGSPYLVMELLEGEGLDQRLSRVGVFRPSEAAAWVAFVARGLEEAHRRGLVHRDLKPGNVFFAKTDRGEVIPKVLDFGVSKAVDRRAGAFSTTNTGAVLGSPAYMSPEQAKGELDIDSRSDVWALGVLLYETLTGRVPFDATNYNALMVKIITEPHVPVTEVATWVTPQLSAIVDEALTKDRDRRIGSASELAERLEAIAMAATGPMPMPSFPRLIDAPTTQSSWSRSRTERRGRSPLWFVAPLVVVAAVGGAIGVGRTRQPLVAVAGRADAALAARLVRFQATVEQMGRVQVEELAPAKPADPDSVAPAIEPDDLPTAPRRGPARPRGTGRTHGAKADTVQKQSIADPHGGVDGAGF